MEPSLLIITSSVTILSLVFLFLYFRKYQDYIDLKNKFEALKHVDEEDHHTQKSRDEFLAMVVHELRSPLAVIKGSADLLLKETERLTAEQIKDMLGEIRSSSSSLIDLVNDLLDVSKIESGRFEIYKKEEDINKLLEDESHRYLALAEEKKIKLELKLDSTIPHFMFDPEKVRQIMNNLISNAIKFTPEGGYIYITSENITRMARVTVADTGIGIPDEVKKRIFHKFVQGRSDGEGENKGTGLGLMIAKGIAEAHGGAIWMQDNKPQGSKFIFTIPLS